MPDIWKILLIIQPIVGSIIVGLLGGNYGRNINNWYKKLKQSPLTPPGYVFGIVWPILYILIGINGYFIYNTLSKLNRQHIFEKLFLNDYIIKYEIQLLLNFSWSLAFFKFNAPKVSLVIVGLMIAFTIYLLIKSFPIDKRAFWVLIPYLLWIIFAAYLNFYIVLKN